MEPFDAETNKKIWLENTELIQKAREEKHRSFFNALDDKIIACCKSGTHSSFRIDYDSSSPSFAQINERYHGFATVSRERERDRDFVWMSFKPSF